MICFYVSGWFQSINVSDLSLNVYIHSPCPGTYLHCCTNVNIPMCLLYTAVIIYISFSLGAVADCYIICIKILNVFLFPSIVNTLKSIRRSWTNSCLWWRTWRGTPAWWEATHTSNSSIINVKETLWHFRKIPKFAFLPRVRWRDGYHSHICALNNKLQPRGS